MQDGAHAARWGTRCRHRGGHRATSEPPSLHHSPTSWDALHGWVCRDPPHTTAGGGTGRQPPTRDAPWAGEAVQNLAAHPPSGAGLRTPSLCGAAPDAIPAPAPVGCSLGRNLGCSRAPSSSPRQAGGNIRALTPPHLGFPPRFPAGCWHWCPFAKANQGPCRQPQERVSQRDEFRLHRASRSQACHHQLHPNSYACHHRCKPGGENPDPARARGTTEHGHVPVPSSRW